MSITINGATNTLTAASGLTVAGDTAVTGTLSATSAILSNYTLTGVAIRALDATTNGKVVRVANTSGNSLFGCEASAAGTWASGSSAYATLVGSTTATSLELITSDTVRVAIDSAGITSIINTTDATSTTAASLKTAGGLGVAKKAYFGDSVLPGADNTVNLGSASLGWRELFCDNGTINTSDARRKTDVSALSAAEINAAKQLAKEIGSFKFLAAVAEKGDAARKHIGMTVQRAIEIMEGKGLDPFAYSFICHDAWGDVFVDHPAVDAIAAQEAVLDEDGNVITPAVDAVEGQAAWTEQTQVAGDKYSFRVHELLLFMSAGFEARLSALEAA